MVTILAQRILWKLCSLCKKIGTEATRMFGTANQTKYTSEEQLQQFVAAIQSIGITKNRTVSGLCPGTYGRFSNKYGHWACNYLLFDFDNTPSTVVWCFTKSSLKLHVNVFSSDTCNAAYRQLSQSNYYLLLVCLKI